jgi:hypothetical protein
MLHDGNMSTELAALAWLANYAKGKAINIALGPFLDLMQRWLMQSGARIDEEFDRALKETLVDVAGLEVNVDRLRKVVESHIADGEARRGLIAAQVEAIRSTEPERLRMLASVFLGLATSDPQKESRHRAFRIALSLEPGDAIFLRQFRELGSKEALSRDHKPGDPMGASGAKNRAVRSRLGMVQRHPASAIALLSNGCLMVRAASILTVMGLGAALRQADDLEAPDQPTLTNIGVEVLDVLWTYDAIATPDKEAEMAPERPRE